MIELEGRYQLTAPRLDEQGATRWTAHDSMLGMTVDVLTLPEDDPRAARLVAATRAAGAVTDTRLQHVVDVGVATTQDGEVAYVVHRRPPGEPLRDRLSNGPLDPTRAAAVIADAAAALGAAHRSGLGHGGISPDVVVVDDDSTTVSGLGVVAALTGRPTSVRGDTRALAAVLYAALTARAATPEVLGLPVAPVSEGRPVRPRLVRAGIPGRLDEITARALGLPGAEPTIDDPDQLAVELQQYLAAVREQQLRHDQRVPTAPDWPWSRLAAIGAVTLILIGAGLAGWQAWSEARSRTPEETGPKPSSSTSASVSPTATPVTVTRVQVLDPQGDGVENNAQAPLAVDGDPTTSWTTLNYASRDLGGLKAGVGLELDFSGLTTVSSVQLQLVGRGTDLTLYSTKSAVSTHGTHGLSGYTPLVRLRGLGDQVTIPLSPAITSRALVIWLTGLPSNGTSYTGGVAEVVVTS
jgi:putative peptidoglycan lipid II flippase